MSYFTPSLFKLTFTPLAIVVPLQNTGDMAR
jgi:hypothetical protein